MTRSIRWLIMKQNIPIIQLFRNFDRHTQRGDLKNHEMTRSIRWLTMKQTSTIPILCKTKSQICKIDIYGEETLKMTRNVCRSTMKQSREFQKHSYLWISTLTDRRTEKWQENDIRWFKKKQSSSIPILLTAIHKFRRSIDIERRTEKPRNDKKIIFVDLKKTEYSNYSHSYPQISTIDRQKKWKTTKLQEAFIDLQWNRPRLFQFFSKYILSINFHDRHIWRENLENDKKHSLIQKETEFEYSNYSQNTFTNFDRHT